MARVKRCEEEFNPWPTFVDAFSSVILVLLLFILVLIVNVAYYMQFNSTTNSQTQVKSKTNHLQAGLDVTDMISLQKVVKPKLDAAGNDSLFSGGKSEGNALQGDTKSDKPKEQSIEKRSEDEFLIAYNSTDVFLQKGAKQKISAFIKDIKQKNKNAKVIISMAYPSNVVSTTMKKKISLSRIINVKNSLKKMNLKLSDMQIDIHQTEDKKYKNGYVKIKIQ